MLAGWALAALLGTGSTVAEPDAIFVSFDGKPSTHPSSGLVVDRLPDSRAILARNEKHGFRLTLPESDWVFRTDRSPMEVTDTEYFIAVTSIRERRSERQHLKRTLKHLRKQPNLMIGRSSIEDFEGRLVLQYYSQSVAGAGGSATSHLEWNYRACIDVARTMNELHLVHRGTQEGPSSRRESTIRRIVRSLELDVEVDER